MSTITNTYRQTWKVGLIIVWAALAGAFFAARFGNDDTNTPAQTTKTWVSQIRQPISGSNAWFDLYSADTLLADW
jgi:hypothetical protein